MAADRADDDATAAATRGSCSSTRAVCSEAKRDYTRGGACDNRRVPSHRATAAIAGLNPYLLLTLTPFFWSCNWIVGRGAGQRHPADGDDLPALVLRDPDPRAVRDRRTSGATGRSLRRHWKILAFLGVIGVGTHNALAYLGLNYTTATNGVILNSFIPVMIITLSWLFLRERLASLQLARGRGLARRRARDPVAGQPRRCCCRSGSTAATCS